MTDNPRNKVNIKPKTILLVEDDPNDVTLIQRAFKKGNIDNPVKVVENGEEAIFYMEGVGEYSNRDKYPLPSLILLDLKLPRKAGHEVLAWIRQRPELKRIPIIVLSSSKQNNDINLAYDLGINSYIIKPVSSKNLLEIIKSIEQYWFKLNEGPEINLGGK